MAGALDFYETAALGLISQSKAAISSFAADTPVEPPSFYIWVAVPSAGGNLVVELADDPENQETTFAITSNGFYPLRVRKIADSTTVTTVIPLYPKEEDLS